MTKHTISVLVENESGVLTRVAGLFSGRGYNIESLCVAPTLDPTVSKMTIVTAGSDAIIEQIVKQLNKLVCVIKVVDLTESKYIDRELALIKVAATDVNNRSEIKQFAEVFRAQVVDVSDRTFTIEVTGDTDKIDALERLLQPYGILEMVRTGEIVIARGPSTAIHPNGHRA